MIIEYFRKYSENVYNILKIIRFKGLSGPFMDQINI